MRRQTIQHELSEGVFAVWDSTHIPRKTLEADAAVVAEQVKKLEEMLGLPPREVESEEA